MHGAPAQTRRPVVRSSGWGDDPDARPADDPTMSPIARLLLLVLAALAVLMLCILALLDTDDVWLVVVTVASIVLIAVVLAIDIWRMVGATGDEAEGPGPREA
jgi:hypothetical protein